MGYSCTLSFQLPDPQFGRLLDALSHWMPAADLATLTSLYRQPPQDECCLSFLLQPDELPADILECCGPPTASGLRPVGCIWSCLSRQGEQLNLHLTPATSTLARFFSESPALRAILQNIASAASARLLHLDEWGEERQWWPAD